MFKVVLNILDELMVVLFIVAAVLLFVGCDTVLIKERVVYEEDRMPVIDAKVHQWTDEGYNGYTTTDENGEWSLQVPEDTIIYLCIENPNNDNELVCYESGYLMTPTLESGETEMTKVE